MANFENLSSDFQTIAMDIYSSLTQAADLNNNNNNSNLHFQTFHPSSTSLDSLFLHHHHHHQQQLLHFHGNSPDNSYNVSSTSSFLHSDHNNVNDNKKRKALLQTLSSSENSGVSDNANIVTTEAGSLRRGKKLKKKKEEDGKEREVVHVRARRGQATDSHSLAERVRRGKINERLRCLQDMVPGCSKAMGMATMLDEIINYVQSLQSQVEFLSMKLTAASSFYDFNSETDAVDSMQRAKARETVEMGRQTRDGSPVFHLSTWSL